MLKTKDKGKILKRIGKGEKGSYTFILSAIQWLADSQEKQWKPETMEQYLNGLKISFSNDDEIKVFQRNVY